jgi:hypothetical protein
MKNFQYDYHRNGVGGRSFYVATWDDPDDGPMFAVLFHTGEDAAGLPVFDADWTTLDCRGVECAVFNRERLGEGEIRFGRNSWRGDRYVGAVGAEIRQREAQRNDYEEARHWALKWWPGLVVPSWEDRAAK